MMYLLCVSIGILVGAILRGLVIRSREKTAHPSTIDFRTVNQNVFDCSGGPIAGYADVTLVMLGNNEYAIIYMDNTVPLSQEELFRRLDEAKKNNA